VEKAGPSPCYRLSGLESGQRNAVAGKEMICYGLVSIRQYLANSLKH
jgi:hypothetical protein